MSSIKRTAQLIEAAYKNNDVASARLAFDEFQQSQCYYPQRQLIYDAHTQTTRYITINCGKCYHCMESKINEWCTRMYAHAEDFKNVYFITLTYRGITDSTKSVNKLLLNKLTQAVWHRDPFNQTHHLCYNPCLLVKKHYQDFLKRLRKNTGLKDLSYVLCGEYGKKYGRPHFHMILFSNSKITAEDIRRAWSVCLWRNNSGEWSYRTNQKNNGIAYDFPIGRIDFNDLVENGSFNTTAKIKVDGSYMNAHQCFAYVCKYVCKRVDPNQARVNIAYNNLFKTAAYVDIYGTAVPFDQAKQHLINIGYTPKQADQCLTNLKNKTYEKKLFQPSAQIYNFGLAQNKGCPLDEGQKLICKTFFSSLPLPNPVIFPEFPFDFREKFSPFVEFSRGLPIGSVYARRNLQEFKDGIFTRPLLQTSGFVVPSYFRRKAEESKYGLRICRKTLKSQSFALGGLTDLLGRLLRASAYNVPLREHFNSKNAGDADYITALHANCRAFADLSTGERIVLADGFARHYKYDKSKREYVSTRNIRVADWIRYWCDSLTQEFSRYADKQRVSHENESTRERALLTLADFVGDYSALRDNFVARQDQYLKEQQRSYDALHAFVE